MQFGETACKEDAISPAIDVLGKAIEVAAPQSKASAALDEVCAALAGEYLLAAQHGHEGVEKLEVAIDIMQ
eukprot:2674334-Ditylum_brightwellii.AAC.1